MLNPVSEETPLRSVETTNLHNLSCVNTQAYVEEQYYIDFFKDKHKKFRLIRDKHKKNENILRCIYYILGTTTTLAGSAVTFITGLTLEGSGWVRTINLIVLCLSFYILMINSLLNFGKLEDKMSKHEQYKSQYEKVMLEIEEQVTTTSSCLDVKELQHFKDIINEKEKLFVDTHSDSFCF